MTWHWKQLLPVDRFSVRASSYVTEIDRLVLTLLYQPLIGAVAHSLYMTLLAQLEKDTYWSEEQTHRQLMTMLGVSLQVIYEERKKLEGIGLLKTFKRTQSDETEYVYELIPPMSPKQFFTNDVLSVYLYNRVGKSHYLQLRERFTLHSFDEETYTELTYAFDEVFTSLKHSEMVTNLQSEKGNALMIDEGKEVISKEEGKDLSFTYEQFDFELLEASLAKSIMPRGGLTPEHKDIIGKLAFVYKVEPLEMSDLIAQVLVQSDELDVNALRKKVQDWYKFEHGTTPPSLGLKTHPEMYRTTANKKLETEEERTIHFYETTSPLTLLEIRSVGAQVAPADMKVVESLLIDYKLLPGVANVLIDFVLYNNDLKLPKALVHKIAGHWSRKKIKTVKEAMELALSERKKEQQTNKTSYKQSRNRVVRQDTLPKWLIEEMEKENNNSKQETLVKEDKKDDKEEKSFEEMLEELKKLKEKRKR